MLGPFQPSTTTKVSVKRAAGGVEQYGFAQARVGRLNRTAWGLRRSRSELLSRDTYIVPGNPSPLLVLQLHQLSSHDDPSVSFKFDDNIVLP